MELEQLPRAQRVFKKYVDTKVQELIKQSQDLSQKYIERRQQLLQRTHQIQLSRKNFEKYLFILEKALSLPPSLRQQIQQTKGLNETQLRDLINDLHQILSKYDQERKQTTQDFENSQEYIVKTEQTLELEDKSQDQLQLIKKESKIKKSKLIKIGLNCLQSFSILVCLLAMVIFFYRLLRPS